MDEWWLFAGGVILDWWLVDGRLTFDWRYWVIVDQVVENVLDPKISPSPALVPRAKLAFVVLERRAFSTHGRNLALKQVLTSCQFQWWSDYEMCISGSYRECFSTSVQLGHPDFPLTPQVWWGLWLFQWEWHFDEIFSAVQLDVSGLAISNGRLWLWLPVNCHRCHHRQSLHFLSLDCCKVALKPIGCIGR